jgi:hypothetical protein
VQVDVRIDEIVLRALAVQPELRFATAAEFRTQIETATQGRSASSREVETPRYAPVLAFLEALFGIKFMSKAAIRFIHLSSIGFLAFSRLCAASGLAPMFWILRFFSD